MLMQTVLLTSHLKGIIRYFSVTPRHGMLVRCVDLYTTPHISIYSRTPESRVYIAYHVSMMTSSTPRSTLLSDHTRLYLRTTLETCALAADAHLAVLADPTGQPLARFGRIQSPHMEDVCALIAGQLGTSNALATSLKVESDFTLLSGEGGKYCYYLSAPAGYQLFFLTTGTVSWGWVRHLIRQCHERLVPTLLDLDHAYTVAA